MNKSDGFNEVTVDWQGPAAKIDVDAIPQYDASDADVEIYQRDGVVLLRGVFVDWVDTLRRGLQRNLDNPQNFAFPCESNPEGAPGRFFDSYCNWQLIPEYFDYVSHSCCASMAGQFMRSDTAQLFHEHAFLKAPGTQHATPWHQDLPYYCVDGKRTVSVYVSLDHAPEDVAVRFIRGSHRWNQLFHPRVFLDGASFPQSLNDPAMMPTPDIDSHPDDYDIAAWSLEPGDAIIFDFRTLHGTEIARRSHSSAAFPDHPCRYSGNENGVLYKAGYHR